MTKNPLIALFLAVSFLIVTNVMADTITSSSNSVTFNWNFPDADKNFSLTAKENGERGVDFTFTSGQNGANAFDDISNLYFFGFQDVSQVFAKDPLRGVGGQMSGLLGEEGYVFDDGPASVFLNMFANFAVNTEGYNAETGEFRFTFDFLEEAYWNGFLEQLENVIIGVAGDGSVYFTNNQTVDSIHEGGTPTPEPATLAMLGFGLAGLGLTARRRYK